MNRIENIKTSLQQNLHNAKLNLIDESHMHHNATNRQSHFKLIIVWQGFAQSSAVSRHRQIYSLLDSEFKNGLKALALHCYTPNEYSKVLDNQISSPLCVNKRTSN